MYCDRAKLRDLIRLAQAEGRVSEELAILVGRIALGIYQGWYLSLDECDFVQECLVHFLHRYQQCDTSRPASHIFSWLSEMFKRIGWMDARSQAMNRRHLRRYAHVLGKNVPEK